MVPSLGALTADGYRGAGPGLLYGDHRGRRAGSDSGNPAESGELLAFLEWLRANCPDAERFWPAQATANHVLSGRAALDTTTAFTAYPLFDGARWDPDAARRGGGRARAATGDRRGSRARRSRRRSGRTVARRRNDRRDGRADRRRRGRHRRCARHLRHHVDHVGGDGRRVDREARAVDDPAHRAQAVVDRRTVERGRSLPQLGGRSRVAVGEATRRRRCTWRRRRSERRAGLVAVRARRADAVASARPARVAARAQPAAWSRSCAPRRVRGRRIRRPSPSRPGR